MDARHFDTLTRALAQGGSRRGLLGLLTTLPVLGGLFALFDREETDAKGRRKRRKKRHKHGKGRNKGKHKKPKCTPHSKTKTCSGKCGPVKNNCKKTVDCGSCDCPELCDECFICQSGPNTPGVCVPDPDKTGEPCGSDGQVCQANGACACQAGSCPDAAPICQLGACAPCTTNTQCQIAGLGDRCCVATGVCRECCSSADCSGATPICISGTCEPCTDDPTACPNDDCCDGESGACVATCPSAAPTCGADNVCAPCESDGECGDDALCIEGACVTCDVTCSGTPGQCGTALQVALNSPGPDNTVYVCPGRYTANFTLNADITIIGAGDGADPSRDAILDAQASGRVLNIASGVTAVVQGVRITGGKVVDSEGGGINNNGDLTMTGCTLIANQAVAGAVGFGFGGGIDNSTVGTLSMTNCTIANNSAAIEGGGISLLQGTHTLTNCTFSGNTAGFRGGAIRANNGGATTLVGCTVGPGNNAPNAAIFVSSDSEFILDATSVSGNTGTNAGGVENLDSTVTLQNGSTVSGNSPNNCVGAITGPGCAP